MEALPPPRKLPPALALPLPQSPPGSVHQRPLSSSRSTSAIGSQRSVRRQQLTEPLQPVRTHALDLSPGVEAKLRGCSSTQCTGLVDCTDVAPARLTSAVLPPLSTAGEVSADLTGPSSTTVAASSPCFVSDACDSRLRASPLVATTGLDALAKPKWSRSVGGSGAIKAHVSLRVMARFHGVEVDVALTEGEVVNGLGRGFPLRPSAETAAMADIRSHAGGIRGDIIVKGVPPIPFGVQVLPTQASSSTVSPCGSSGTSSTTSLTSLFKRRIPSTTNLADRINFVGAEHRQKTVVASIDRSSDGEELLGTASSSRRGVGGEGIVVEVAMVSADAASVEITMTVRKARKKELARLAQEEILVSAMEKRRYGALLAQITKSRRKRVESALIDQAGALLRSITLPDSQFLTHKDLSKMMKWRKATTTNGTVEVEPCLLSAGCPCNAGDAEPGESCTVVDNVVQDALQDVVPPKGGPADRWLFQALVKAAQIAPEGCVWKSGGKFLFTNEERNQSPNAIVAVLERDNKESEAARGIRALIDYTEREYNFRVTAVQLNLHPDQGSFHKQHRDIYGAGFKGGINCTCTFAKCTGTVCYSLGSSRQVLCETMLDTRSRYVACGDSCEGCKTYRWVHSGSAMYFNDPWNNNHSHGVPHLEEPCGPRISIALLCA